MATGRVCKTLLAGVVLVLVVTLLVQASVVSTPWGQDRTTVTVLDDDGEPKATVEVEVADTLQERYTGLSDHDSLEAGHGMLFVHASEDDRTYVMREMDFDIDIVFIGGDRTVTSIENARAPEPGEDGEELRYSGRAQWVLEVPRGYANETEMAVGDDVAIDDG
ncbi:DUF192 domain-containing protein [Natrarchaeobius halalkaliphilus]|uniref:DUF192 domain-containing protein n=1 Tax=Natrarchaeobius halalkaliphilus TaxID=1679091 RepID=A0A3N6MGP0_9EURY|nr:DUF192 domain-containing protein [Natrarchaeobius halalkaliphilus]RQG93136.1 DUF192 domain-containing protein [Natrarchaeobius halalkaliphilus]